MTGYFSPEQLDELNRGRQKVQRQFLDLQGRYLSRRFKTPRAKEYAQHGFGRRLGTIVRAIERVYELLPPEREDIPSHDDVIDATISIQSFVLNTFGCLDNLAWIWVYEKDVKRTDGNELEPKQVGLGTIHKEVRRSFSNELRTYLDSRQEWFDHIKNFRDSLVHRIPLYIPPYIVTPENSEQHNLLEHAAHEALQRLDVQEYDRLRIEQKKFGLFRPWMTHSIYENAPSVLFHPQLLCDYATVDEIGQTILKELDR